MADRLTKITTKTGDDGTTGLANGNRVAKDSEIIEAIGSVDECNCVIGLILSEDNITNDVTDVLNKIQHKLFDLGAELASENKQYIHDKDIKTIEQTIKHYNDQLPTLKEFILPQGARASVLCHQARAVCRRAERCLVSVPEAYPNCLIYLNRLSDLLFILARVITATVAGSEVYWQKQ